jgi:hypothetical protein
LVNAKQIPSAIAKKVAALPKISAEKSEFDVLNALSGLAQNPARKKEILAENEPLTNDDYLTAFRFPIPNIRGDKALTRRLLGFVQIDTFLVTIEAKKLRNRARPYQRKHTPNPMFLVGHPSFPSGHATEAFVIVEVFRLVWALDKDGRTEAQPWKNATKAERMAAEYAFHRLQCFAENYALNREIAGVHFRSDTEAGRKLTVHIIDAFKKNKGFLSDVRDAQREWML